MKTKKTNREEMRENTVSVPMTQEEKERIRKKAESMGLTMAALIRMTMNKIIERSDE